MTFDFAGLWGYVLLASPILVLLLTAWAYALGEAAARARPTTEFAPDVAPPSERAPGPGVAPAVAKQMPETTAPSAAP